MAILHRKFNHEQGTKNSKDNTQNNVSHPNVSPKEQMLLHANLKLMSIGLPQKWLHV